MPLPVPNTNEVKDRWIDRCMGNPTMNKDFPKVAQRRAVCESIWERSKQKGK